MNKKSLIIIGSGLLLGLIGAGGYLYYMSVQDAKKITTPVVQAPQKMVIDYATWKDPLDVSFSYPAGAVVNKHDEDKENYMHVDITSATYSGGLVLWAKDFPKGVTDLSSWAKKETASGSGVIVDTTVGGVDAKKIIFGTTSVHIGVIYDGLLFEIDGTLDDKGYWNDVMDKAVSSYVFYPVDGVKASSSAPSSGVNNSSAGADEEEVLE